MARIDVRIVDTQSWGVLANSSFESSNVVVVKDKQHLDVVLHELRD